MEAKDQEEYKKRIKELIERVEKTEDKDSQYTEQDIIEAKERLLQSAKSKIHPYFRREMILLAFVYNIRDYYKKRAESKNKGKFQEEIDNLYNLIFKELIKTNPMIPSFNRRFKKKGERLDRKRILKKMTRILGMENLFRDFYKHYDIKEATRTDLYTKEIIQCLLILIVGISVIILAINGIDGIIP